MTSHTPEMLAKARESAAAWWEARHNARRLANQIRDGLQDHQAEVQIALAALTAARDERAGVWQPIETAPTNASVLVFIPNAEHYGHGVYRAMLVDMGTGRRWMTSGLHIGRDCGVDSQPTHWRPLPSPPSTDGEVG